MKKIYAARGLLDFQMCLKFSGATIRICFSGGSMGSNGVIPAKYETDNKIIQDLIEASKQFEDKRVYIYEIKTNEN